MSALTLGCKVNQYDTNAMLTSLEAAGYEVVPWGEQSDLCLVNTCTVTAVADRKSRNAIKRASRSGALVCVSGCLAEKDAELVRRLEGVDIVVGMRDRARLPELVRAFFPEMDGSTPDAMHVRTAGGKTRGFLKVQEGCSNHCSYCIIPAVRGVPRSRQVEDILADAQRLVRSGAREIVLTGIHLCSYGADTGTELADLVETVSGVEGLERLQLGSLEPGYLTQRVLDRLSACGLLIPHFHISLQSGCGKTLRAMCRKYTPVEYEHVLERIRRLWSDPSLTTDVITGFPGETDDDFAESLRFVSGCRFARLHVFPYSAREGTPAARMKNQVPEVVRKARAAAMSEVGAHCASEYAAGFLGTTQRVLFDKDEGSGWTSGYTDRYLRVRALGAPIGTIAPVHLEKMDTRGCSGTLANVI